MQLNPIDILKVVLACAVFIAITLGWVHQSRQTAVSKAPRQSLVITVRWIYVFAVFYIVFSVWLGVSVNLLLILLTVMFLLMPFSSVDNDPIFLGGSVDAVGLTIGLLIYLVVFLPPYLMKQFVLGFPERDKFVLSPPEAFRASMPRPSMEK